MITKRIEENLFNKPKKHEIINDDSGINDYQPVQQLLNKYKEQISMIKSKMNGFYNIKRLIILNQDRKFREWNKGKKRNFK